jgi:hypothetical protein
MYINIREMSQNICSRHLIEYKENYIVSPCRGKCKKCKTKRVHGYSNPDHVTNSFGYLFLFPEICDNCANTYKQCIWCVTK